MRKKSKPSFQGAAVHDDDSGKGHILRALHTIIKRVRCNLGCMVGALASWYVVVYIASGALVLR